MAKHREGIRLKPGVAGAHYLLGNALHLKGDVDGAIAAFRRAIALTPNHAQAHNNLGVVYRERGLTDLAVARTTMMSAAPRIKRWLSSTSH